LIFEESDKLLSDKRIAGLHFFRNPMISARRYASGIVLFNPDNRDERQLNYTGTSIWKNLNRAATISNLMKELSDDFEIDNISSLEGDVSDFIRDFYFSGFILEGVAQDIESDFQIPDIQDAPSGFDLSITKHCNLKCSHCFYDHIMDQRSDMSMSRWFECFREFKKLAIKDVTLTGGEAFTRNGLWEMIDEIIQSRMRYSILTNGTLIDENVIRHIFDHNRAVRCDSIQVSLDGSCSKIHDAVRGVGSFAKAVRGIELLKEAELPISVRVTISQNNLNDLDDIADLLLNKLALPAFSTNDVVAIGAGCDNQNEIGLNPGQRKQAMIDLARINEKYDNRIAATAGPIALWRIYGEMEKAASSNYRASTWEMGSLSACGCIFQRLAAHHDGAITPCHMLPDLVIGQLGSDSISEIWKNHPVLESMRSRRNIPMSELQECKGCEWTSFCNGSCPALPYQADGRMDSANKSDCYKLFLEQTGGQKPWVISE